LNHYLALGPEGPVVSSRVRKGGELYS
jgi:hypothetical protein